MNNNLANKSIPLNRFSKFQLAIQALREKINLTQPLWAINWFDCIHPKGYGLYGLLAYPFVKKVNGVAVFKGKLRRYLQGDKNMQRDTLLIVRYPHADAFLAMVRRTWFQLISPIRQFSVANFSFGFMHSLQLEAELSKKQAPLKRSYLVHALTIAHKDLADLEQKVVSLTASDGVELFFLGNSVAQLGKLAQQQFAPLPLIIDAVIIFTASKDSTLEQFINTPAYQKLLQSFEHY